MKGVTVLITGDVDASTITNHEGKYTFIVPPGISYNVTPSKPAVSPGTGPINTVDGVAVMSTYLQFSTLKCDAAADVNGDGIIDTRDIVAIQRFTLGINTGISFAGQYRFAPAGTGPNDFIGALIGDAQ